MCAGFLSFKNTFIHSPIFDKPNKKLLCNFLDIRDVTPTEMKLYYVCVCIFVCVYVCVKKGCNFRPTDSN